MTPRWEAVATRARGLATHLLDERALAALGRAADRGELARMLDSGPYRDAVRRTGDDVETVERAVTRVHAARLALLVRWLRPDERVLAPVFLALDAAAVRGIVRGILGGVPPEARIEDAIPTPTLGRKELMLVAGAQSVGALGALLRAWEHPLGSALGPESDDRRPDAFEIEAALGRVLGRALSESVARADRDLRAYVSEEIDAWNVETALVLAGGGAEVDPRTLFVEGGSAVDPEGFVLGASAPDRDRCADALAAAARGTLFERPLRASPATPAAVDDRILDARIARLSAEVRRRPLGSAPVLLFVLRLRRERRALRHALWRTSLATARSG